jgi:hypothetical protein
VWWRSFANNLVIVAAAIDIFLFCGAAMASLAATTLLWRGTALDRLWALNPKARKS